MIQITPQMRIWLAVEPVDFRKGIDGLAQVCRQHLKVDPMAGALVVFSSRRRKALKCLVFDGQGFWLCQKRLSQGRFSWWPTDAKPPTFGLDAHQLQSLLWNAKPASSHVVPLWRPMNSVKIPNRRLPRPPAAANRKGSGIRLARDRNRRTSTVRKIRWRNFLTRSSANLGRANAPGENAPTSPATTPSPPRRPTRPRG